MKTAELSRNYQVQYAPEMSTVYQTWANFRTLNAAKRYITFRVRNCGESLGRYKINLNIDLHIYE